MSYPLIDTVDADREAIREAIRDLTDEWPGAHLAVGGSWSSPKNTALNQLGALDAVKDKILSMLPEPPPAGKIWTMLCWANLVKPGDAIERHDHKWHWRNVPPSPGREAEANSYAAIYYVRGAGQIQFHTLDGVQTVDVQPRMLLVFPAALSHSVPKYGPADAENRVSVAFNIRAVPA